MSALTRILRPLRQAASAFFTCDLTLRRDEQGMQVVLESRGAASGKKRSLSRDELARQKQAAELFLMQEQLRALLDELPETRRCLRQLVFVERALERKGLRALNKLPLNVLQRALEQFEGLVSNWSPMGLADLRSKMAVAIIDRGHENPAAESEAYNTAALLEDEGDPTVLPEMELRTDDEALAAAYAAMSDLAPTPLQVQVQGELGSTSARAAANTASRHTDATEPLKLRELQE